MAACVAEISSPKLPIKSMDLTPVVALSKGVNCIAGVYCGIDVVSGLNQDSLAANNCDTC